MYAELPISWTGSDCGIGLTPRGYYMCAVAGGIDRVFGFNRGRAHIPDDSDDMTDQMALFCRLCGHFGFAWPTRKKKVSPTWKKAYEKKKRELKNKDKETK